MEREGLTLDTWFLENLRIRDKKTGDLVPFRLNIAQHKVLKTLDLQAERDLPVRALVVKARQEGVSTLIEALLFQRVNHYSNKLAQIVSHDLDSSHLIFNMSKLFQDELPPDLKRVTDYSNKKEIAYTAPHRSKLMVQTAGKDNIGRGGTVHYFHGSEVAFWPNAKEGLGGALQQVPKTSGTIVVLESTGNGVGGEFYDRYIQAVDELSHNPEDYTGFLPIFLAWHTFPEYSCPLGRYTLVPTEEERELANKFDLTPEQLYWRRLTIKTECGGDEILFKQEYPADWREAFQASGSCVFSNYLLDKWERKAHAGRTVIFDKDKIMDIHRTANCWQIWELPRPDHDYCHGIDTAEGKVCDKLNPKSEPDYHAAIIYDRQTNAIVAQYFGRCDQVDLGKQCLQASRFYNNAWTAPEIPNGMVVLDIFKQAGYQNLYSRQIHDERLVADETEDLGWRTTVHTRPLMVEGLIKLIRETNVNVFSPELIRQMRTFVRDKTGKPTHLPGEHDDLVIAFMIAVQLHLRCPISKPYEYATTGDYETPKIHDLAYANAIDPFAAELLSDEPDLYEFE